VRKSRPGLRAALDPSTAAWAILALGDTQTDRDAASDAQKIVSVLVFADADGPRVSA
jgi:hypothetical protein